MQTLAINTTSTVVVKTDIHIPLFRRKVNESAYIGVLDENTCVRMAIHKGYMCVTNSEIEGHEQRQILESIESEEWTSCTESEFLEKYDSVIESISLHRKLAV